jgi:poly(3-hydroxybutyrate) depolymerase
MRRLAPTLLFLLLLAAVAAAQEVDLAAAVDQPTPEARRKAALALARRTDLDLTALLSAMRSLEPKGPASKGTDEVTVPLVVDGTTEETRITVHVPQSYDPKKPAPLILALHGAGGQGSEEADLWHDVADALGMIVVAPTEAGENKGYGFTRKERDEALAALRWARRRFNVDENRIHLSGVSRGGHMTWDIGTRHPDLFATLSPMIGGPRLDTRGGQNNLRYVANVAHLPIRDLQGEEDDKRMLFSLGLAFERLKAAGAPDAQLITFPGVGHGFRFDAVDWGTFLGGARRDPCPGKVLRLCADPKEGRAFWAEVTGVATTVREDFTPQVDAREWAGMDDAAQRRYVADAADKKTARLEAERKGKGDFVVKTEGVRSFRLLLAEDMFDPKEPVKVTWNGRTRTKKVSPSREVLLLDFVERFDRTFLPVAELEIP